MASQTFTILPIANRTGQIPAKPENFAIDWPAQVKSANFRINSTEYTDPATGIDMTVKQSLDGGTTWTLMTASTGSRGGGLDRHGNPALPSLNISLGDEEMGIPRKIMGEINVTGVVRFGLLVDVSTTS